MRRALTRREFLEWSAAAAGIAAVGTLAAAGGAAGAPVANVSAAQLKTAHPTRFRILQFTDLHFFAGKEITHDLVNGRTVAIMQALVKKTKPDLLMVTGDLWPEDRDGKGETYMRSAIQFIEALGAPWAYTWGNHDQLPDYAVGHKAFAAAKDSLYRGADSDGNYVIDIVDRRGRRQWQIVCLNSHGDGLQREQQQWVQSLGQTVPPVPRFAFFHIPLKQYDDIWKNGTAMGIKGETPCIEKEDGSSLAILKAAGVKACFCGHDHVNDYAGVVDGVELVYGRATGAGGYGAEVLPKGGKLITVNCKTGRYEWVSITPDGARWHPKPGEHLDKSDQKRT